MFDIDQFIDACESYKIKFDAMEGTNTIASETAHFAIIKAKEAICDVLRYKSSGRTYDAHNRLDQAIDYLKEAKESIHHLPINIGSVIIGNIADELSDLAQMIGANIVGNIFGQKQVGKIGYKMSKTIGVVTSLYRAAIDYSNDDLNLTNFNQYINSLMNDLDIMIARCLIIKRFL